MLADDKARTETETETNAGNTPNTKMENKWPMKVDKPTFLRWQKYSLLLLQENDKTIKDITTGLQAWNIAHKLDIPREAYHMGLNDTHIQTALKRIFPYAVFKR